MFHCPQCPNTTSFALEESLRHMVRISIPWPKRPEQPYRVHEELTRPLVTWHLVTCRECGTSGTPGAFGYAGDPV